MLQYQRLIGIYEGNNDQYCKNMYVEEPKDPKRHKETWCWNEQVSVPVSEKKLSFRKWFEIMAHESWKKYKESRQYAKVSHAKEYTKRELAGDLDKKTEPTPALQNCKADS